MATASTETRSIEDRPADSPGDATDVPPLEQVYWLFRDAELPFPPMPRELADRLEAVDQWLFTSRADLAGSPYDLEGFVAEAIAGGVADYVLLGQAGHGVGNVAIHYFLVDGPLALFVQIRWGGAYVDEDEAVARLAEDFSAAADLIAAAERARAGGRLSPDERLVVVDSYRIGNRFARVRLGAADAIVWTEAPNALLAALTWLEREERDALTG